MKKDTLKWAPATPMKLPDNIMSSRARENGESGFTPTYEKERRENMNFIMSNEYMRIWFKERGQYEIDTYAKLQAETGSNTLKRKYVQRFIKPRQKGQPTLPPIKLKRFADIPSRTDSKPRKIKTEGEKTE